MSKAILMKAPESSFLVEIDSLVELPPGSVSLSKQRNAEAGDFEEVVDLNPIVRDFSEIKNLIITCCNSLYQAVEAIPKPEKVAIEFGIKLAGETGVPMLTKASGEANFKVNVEWKPQ